LSLSESRKLELELLSVDARASAMECMSFFVVAGLANSWYARVAKLVRPCALQLIGAES
jgi:hypothetical protein